MQSLDLLEASKSLEGITFEKTHELTPTEKALWARARQGRGRPRKPDGEKSRRVLVTVAPGLLAQADAYAKRKGLSRAELFARGLRAVLPKS
jgi:hypothetical protein